MDGAVGAGLGLQVDRNVFCFFPRLSQGEAQTVHGIFANNN